MLSAPVYVAGSSGELARAERAMNWVRETPGLELAHDWVTQIRERGYANPRDFGMDEVRYELARLALSKVRVAVLVWLLLPEEDTIGAWCELGAAAAFAMAMDGPTKTIVTTGKEDRRTIFTALKHAHFDRDREAVRWLRERGGSPTR